MKKLSNYTSILFHSDGNLLYRTLKELHISTEMCNIAEYHGVGSGTIVAFLSYLGMSPSDIITELVRTSIFNSTLSQLPILIKTLIGDKLMEIFSMIPSLEELYELLGSSKVLNLYVYNTTTKSINVINHQTCPDMDSITACVMSYNLGSVYYSQSYCGNSYLDASMSDISAIHFSAKTLCIHVRSSYNNPQDAEEYYKICANSLRGLLLERVQGLDLIVIDVKSSPWNDTLATKLSIMYEESIS